MALLFAIPMLEQLPPTGTAPPARAKLGLALAGGGFRAALFHVGVLRRLAEFDLLRHVEVLSTVSGGSIVGALYAVALRDVLNGTVSGLLKRQEYIDIVKAVQRRVEHGVSVNLRTRLLMNPLRVFWMIVFWRGLGTHLAALFDLHFFGARRSIFRQRSSVKLRDLQTKRLDRGLEEDNSQVLRGAAEALSRGRTDAGAPLPAARTKLIINSTALNSGSRFWFSRNEVGDWRLGFFRHDEIDEVLRRKPLWECSWEVLRTATKGAQEGGFAEIEQKGYRLSELGMAAWLRSVPPEQQQQPTSVGWTSFDLARLESLRTTEEYGYLRQAKVAAWYLRRGKNSNPPVPAGVPDEVLQYRFRLALENIDDSMSAELTNDQKRLNDAYDFMLELYYSRSAEVASPRLRKDFEELRLADAVAASANFPPVFPPYRFFGFFDDTQTSRLGLTDGGVYENAGVTALLDEDCNYLIVSDSGAPFRRRRRSAIGRVGMMYRVGDALMSGVSWRQKAYVNALRNGGEVRRYAWVSIDGPACAPTIGNEPEPLGIDGHSVARLRTDLDAFGEAEVAVLINRGYDQADRYLRRYFHASARTSAGCRHQHPSEFDAVVDWYAPRDLPFAIDTIPKDIDSILTAGRRRFGRTLWLRWPAYLAITVVAIAAMAMSSLVPDATALASVVHDRPALLRTAIAWVTWRVPPGWILGTIAAWLVIVALGSVANVPRELAARGWLAPARVLGVVVERGRGLSYNLLWLAGPWPALIAIATSLAAWISHLLFAVPFLRATRRVRR
jgi:predicted acylesterase/phospholipase RssA